MSLPDLCPLDDKPCKGRECHLYCVEWRTKDPMCLVGYRSTAKIMTGSARVQDTYAAETFKKLGRPSRQQTVISEDEEVEKPAEMKRKRFKPWPEFPVRGRTEKPSGESPDETFGSGKTQRRDEVSKPEDAVRGREAVRSGNTVRGRNAVSSDKAENVSSGLESRTGGRSIRTEPLVKKSPEFKERVVSRDIHATIFSSVSESEKPAASSSGRESTSGRKPDEEQDKRRKLDKIMELDLPDEYEEEFWS